jgi:hypothetical protein
MSASRHLSYSSPVASPLVALKCRWTHAMLATATAVEPLERRVCLSVSFSGAVSWAYR